MQELEMRYRAVGIDAGALCPTSHPVSFLEELERQLMRGGVSVGTRQQKGSEQNAQSPADCSFR
jgi:hypothetical protein